MRAPSDWKLRLTIALAVVAIIALRKHDSLTNPQFWAEDGGLFFIDAERNSSWLLLVPRAGYLHLLPRLVAVVGRNLPLIAVPAFYAWFALLATGAVAWGIQSPRVGLPGTRIAALAIALIPHTGEVYVTVCNLQWVMAIGLFALAIAKDARNALERTLDVLALAVLGLTGPFIAIALPVFAWRAWRRRSGWSVVLLALALGCLAIQAPTMLAYSPEKHPQAWAPMHGAAEVGRRLVVSLLAGHFNPGEPVCMILSLIVPMLLAWILWRRRTELPGGLPLLAAGLATLAAGAFKIRADTISFDDLLNGDRYYFTPKVLLVWLVAAVACTCGRSTRRVLTAVAVASFIASLPQFIFPAYPDLHWMHYSQLIKQGVPVRVPILPDGFTFTWPGGKPPGK